MPMVCRYLQWWTCPLRNTGKFFGGPVSKRGRLKITLTEKLKPVIVMTYNFIYKDVEFMQKKNGGQITGK